MTHQDRLDRILPMLPPDDAAWLSEQLDPPWKQRARRLDARDAAIREALALLIRGGAPSHASAEAELVRRLNRYLSTAAWRTERDLPALPESADPLPRLLHRIARANHGRGLSLGHLPHIRRGERTPLPKS